MKPRLLCLLFFSAATTFAATVDPPLRYRIVKLDRTEVAGLITSYDDTGVTVMDAKKQEHAVSWEEMPPDMNVTLHERLWRNASGEDWLNLGKKLSGLPGGKDAANRAFGKALRTDKNLKDQVEAARKEARVAPVATRQTPPALTSTPPPMDQVPTTERSPFDPRDPQKKIVGPQKSGAVDVSAWGPLSPQQQADAVAKLKQFAADAAKAMNLNLASYETQYFLFYSDLPPADAQRWAGMLDQMYGRLSVLFAINKGENIWHGKALVFVFSREEDYLKFQMKVHKTMAAGTAGMCHTFGSGDVHIAFYRQPNDLDFAHVLVHESIHGFLHRYRSPVDVPSWLNEGLAEAIAADMVPRKGLTQASLADARQELQTRKSLEGMLQADAIVAWQYPVARTLTEFMIRQNKQGYVEFINAIKDGEKWEEALANKYGTTPQALITAYGYSMTVAGLKP
jgi:hypothetical protein